MKEDARDFLSELVGKARKAGADAADAMLIDATDLSVSLRLGALENLERSESGDLGLRVFIGQKQAIVSSTDRSAKAMNELVERAIAMARLAPEDPFCGLAGGLAGDETAQGVGTGDEAAHFERAVDGGVERDADDRGGANGHGRRSPERHGHASVAVAPDII